MFVPLSVLEFRDRAEMYFRDKIGVIDGEKQFSYGEFAQRTHRLANALHMLGIKKGDRVSFITYNTHQLLEAYYGVIEAGAILNPINIRLTPQDIAYILDHSGTSAVFYHSDFSPLVESLRPSLESQPHFVIIEGNIAGAATHEYEGLLSSVSDQYHVDSFDENDVAELFYTSGTTGKPKGVALTHRSLHLHSIYTALGLDLSDADVNLHVVPLFHVNGWGTPHLFTMVGATHVMLRKFDPTSLLQLIEKHRVTHLFAVPLIFNALLHHPHLEKFDLSSLELLMTGGAPSNPTLIKSMHDKFNAMAMAGYGLTETSPVISLARPRKHLTEKEPPEMNQTRLAMTGWATIGTMLRVVDSEDKDVRPDGTHIGEIIARSNVVMEGYYRDPEATGRVIRDGWFHTGDMATLDEHGYVMIKDRSKDIIISGGENISSVEIETALYSHHAVLECAVVAAPDEKWGEAPVAIVVLKPGATASAEELLEHCRTILASFKVPRLVEFREQMPKGGTGKILKAELREPFWRGMQSRVH